MAHIAKSSHNTLKNNDRFEAHIAPFYLAFLSLAELLARPHLHRVGSGHWMTAKKHAPKSGPTTHPLHTT
jgi:hypothetical protein